MTNMAKKIADDNPIKNTDNMMMSIHAVTGVTKFKNTKLNGYTECSFSEFVLVNDDTYRHIDHVKHNGGYSADLLSSGLVGLLSFYNGRKESMKSIGRDVRFYFKLDMPLFCVLVGKTTEDPCDDDVVFVIAPKVECD